MPRVNVEEDNKRITIYQNGSIYYICKALLGTALTEDKWQIKKIDTTSGAVITWCDGNDRYDNVATNLAIVEALSYS